MTRALAPPPAPVPLAYLRQLAAQLRVLGVDIDAWLRQADLRPAALDDTEGELPLATFRTLVQSAMALSGEPALGLLVGQRLQLQSHGVLGYAAQSSGTLGQALALLQAFTRTRLPLLDLTIEERHDVVRLRISPSRALGPIARPVLEAVIVTTKNILDAIAQGTFRFEEVTFPFESPSYAALARKMLGCPVRYGQEVASYTLSRASLSMQLRAADPAAFREAVRLCERELEKLAASETAAGRVRRLFLEHPAGFPSLELAARLLHTTPRTLHRRLLEEGTSFRGVLEDVRHTLALEHLRVGKLAIAEIAHALGYTDLANFRRAFRRWEGRPPSALRGGESTLTRAGRVTAGRAGRAP